MATLGRARGLFDQSKEYLVTTEPRLLSLNVPKPKGTFAAAVEGLGQVHYGGKVQLFCDSVDDEMKWGFISQQFTHSL